MYTSQYRYARAEEAFTMADTFRGDGSKRSMMMIAEGYLAMGDTALAREQKQLELTNGEKENA